MNNYKFFYFSTIFILTALIIFATIILLLPFLAQEVQNISPKLYINIYFDHLHLYSVLWSVLLSIPLIYVLYKKSFNIKKQVSTVTIQSLLLTCLILLVYFNLNYLDELISRPTYE
ncbi:hypothetical protein [Psychrobacillus sp. NPDC096623]|uniref:hypothetical protein n=1 Tax=Psychrobacillus sp. NPDC096623 TaxID=3364492 RepID=UPI0037FCB241